MEPRRLWMVERTVGDLSLCGSASSARAVVLRGAEVVGAPVEHAAVAEPLVVNRDARLQREILGKLHEISDIADRLRTRFVWGLLADIEPSELEVRIAILRKKAGAQGLLREH